MSKKTLKKEPFNLIISGVGGHGNVLLSAFVGTALLNEGFMISVADTFGVSQRGGSVTSHLRTLAEFGNPHVITIVNPRPVYPSGGVPYPDLDEVKKAITKLSSQTTFVSATEEALKMGNPIYTNIILLGSLVGAGILPISKATIMPILEERFPGEQLDANIKAFNKGMELIANA
jgi:indolepyruvate ferredoxin oxidoreductase beta subunit